MINRLSRRTRPLVVCLLICRMVACGSANEPPVTAVVFGPQGDAVLAASQAGVRVLRWPGLASERTIEISMPNAHCLAFSPSGRFVAVGGGYPAERGVVELLAWPSGESVAQFSGHDDSVRALVWVDDNRLVTASIDRDVKLWDVQVRENIMTLQGHSRSVDALCLLNDDKTLVSAGGDQSLRVWDLESGKQIRSLSQHTGAVNALAACTNNTGLPMIASAATDRTIRFWQPTIGRMMRYVRLHSDPLSLVWTPDGSKVLAACADGNVRVVDPVNVTVERDIPVIDGWAYAIAVQPGGGAAVVAGSGGQVRRLSSRQLSGVPSR